MLSTEAELLFIVIKHPGLVLSGEINLAAQQKVNNNARMIVSRLHSDKTLLVYFQRAK